MSFWNRRRNQLQDEIGAHIELEVEENLAAGMSEDEVRAAAQKKFGNVPLAMDRSREVWGTLWLEYFLQDLRYALRALRKSPSYTATVVLTLAVGLGATATILAVVDSVLLRPVSIPHPEQLVMMYGQSRQAGTTGLLSYSQIENLRHHAHLFSAVSAYFTTVEPVVTPDGARVSLFAVLTPGFFKMLGVKAMQGRLFSENDATAPVTVVSNALWRERLHGKSGIVGSTIKIAGKLRTVVGILPRGVYFPFGTSSPAAYIPISLQAKGEGFMSDSSAFVMARMKPGVSIPQARAEAENILAHDYNGNGVKGKLLALQF